MHLLGPISQHFAVPAWNDLNSEALHLTRGAAAPLNGNYVTMRLDADTEGGLDG